MFIDLSMTTLLRKYPSFHADNARETSAPLLRCAVGLISVTPSSPTRSVMKSVQHNQLFIFHLEFTRYLTCMLMYHLFLRHIWSLRSAFEQQGEGQPLRSLRPQSPSAIGQRAPASLFQSH